MGNKSNQFKQQVELFIERHEDTYNQAIAILDFKSKIIDCNDLFVHFLGGISKSNFRRKCFHRFCPIFQPPTFHETREIISQKLSQCFLLEKSEFDLVLESHYGENFASSVIFERIVIQKQHLCFCKFEKKKTTTRKRSKHDQQILTEITTPTVERLIVNDSLSDISCTDAGFESLFRSTDYDPDLIDGIDISDLILEIKLSIQEMQNIHEEFEITEQLNSLNQFFTSFLKDKNELLFLLSERISNIRNEYRLKTRAIEKIIAKKIHHQEIIQKECQQIITENEEMSNLIRQLEKIKKNPQLKVPKTIIEKANQFMQNSPIQVI
ncbi:hypothetical protein M0811_02714 [Anaeramoeba ignava]|uniref:PAS domain-containing protein n=1 Tax=Anaeramoeba ignava TaxID=1746090 RepID=A0A9Q0R6U9_ANAIG|nr:hypothetical protein M0811_02714 [Anaeramoeba ignava]|eukprot:Anaeramoba_ignava/a90057_141.p1 GENE.a90057_141~~a90057_141.p1  ORF type:complete len:324 (+),score=106.14 a90057_141:145-1116(+)